MRAKLAKKLSELFKNKIDISYTITEEYQEDQMLKYIKEFESNQVPYFIVRVKERNKKSIYVFDKKLNLISSIS